MPEFLTLDDFDFKNKVVLVRVDINSPVEKGKITDDSRIRECTKTLKELSDRKAKVIVLAHQGRVGKSDFIALKEHAQIMTEILGKEVRYVDDLFGSRALSAIEELKDGEIIILENTRFYSEEISFDNMPIEAMAKTHLVKNLSSEADYFVNDAFAASHRAQPSLVGFTEVLPSVAGRVMENEIEMLSKALRADKPCIAVLGGAKVDDSIEVASNMLRAKIADRILTTGLVANLFLQAKGYELGNKNIEILKKELKDYDEFLARAQDLLKTFEGEIEIPNDLAVNDNSKRLEFVISELPTENPIQDIGRGTIERYSYFIKSAKTIIANGPAGVFENDNFALGTNELFKAIANTRAYKVFGGGHTNEVIEKLGLKTKIDHLSTGGGACVSFLAGKKMPVIDALKKSKQKYSNYFLAESTRK
ncbi:MAG: phosphoglycerate kinase [Candidatus Thermoplasmatota archaeon]|nr:phosphoglycerate kinase [Candidatus Thermoplasmatota archaeon]